MQFANRHCQRSFFKTFPVLIDGNKRNRKQVPFLLFFCSIRFKTVLEQKSCTWKHTHYTANWHKVYHFLLPTKKKETEAGEILKIWRGQSVIHKYKVFLRNGVCFLFDQMLPLYPLDPPALREIRFRSQQRLQSKLNQKSISQHNVYNFDLGVTELIASHLQFFGKYVNPIFIKRGHITPTT